MKVCPVLLFIFIFCSSLQATTYYVSISGSDDSTGLSPSTAWRNVAYAFGQDLMPGDSLLFKKGDEWTAVQSSFVKSGVAGNPIYVGCYGESEALPIIDNRVRLADLNNPDKWEFSNGIWKNAIGNQSPGRLFLDGMEALRSMDSLTLGMPDSTGATGIWFYKYIDTIGNDTLYMDVSDNPAMLYDTIVGSFRFSTLVIFKSNYVIFDALEIRGGWGQSLRIDSSSHNIIKNCILGRYATSGMAIVDDSNYNRIEHNTFDSHFTFYYGEGSERGCGDGVNLAFAASHNEVYNNSFKNWAHNAVEILVNSTNQLGVNKNRITWNTISAPDIPYAHPFGADGPTGLCQYNEFAYNRVDSCRTAAQVNGNNNHVHHNIFTNMFKSPSKQDITANAFLLGIYGTDLACHDNLFEHNLILNTDEAAFRIRGFGLGAAKNIIIQNNIIINSGLSPFDSAYQAGTAFHVFQENEVDSLIFRNNLVFNTISEAPICFREDSSSYFDLTHFNQLADAAIVALNNLESDPMLDSNFSPADDSPAINNGILFTDSIALDFLDSTRVIGGKIDIGPVENQLICNSNMVIFVDSMAAGANTGLNWADAKTTIYEAINICPAVEQKSIWLAKGTYFPTNTTDRNMSFDLNDSMSLYGGFSGNELNLTGRDLEMNKSILSGDIGMVNDTSDNSFHVIAHLQDSSIAYYDIIIENGNAVDQGGGILLEQSTVHFEGCTFRNNYALSSAAAFIENSYVTFDGNHFLGNQSLIGQDFIIDAQSQVQILNCLIEQGIFNLGNCLIRESTFILQGIDDEILNSGIINIEDNNIVEVKTN